MLSPLFRLAFPTDCFCCGEPLRRRQSLGACPACWSALAPLRPPLCGRCGIARPATTDLLGPAGNVCARCLLAPPAADSVRAAVAYDSISQRFMLRVKFGRRRELVRPLARQLACSIRAAGMDRNCSLITSVPSNPLSDLRRGFSPSHELARLLASDLKLELRGSMISRRIFHGTALKRLGAAGRKRQAKSAFSMNMRLDGETVLLVDDIMTTGASVEICARLLKKAGAAEVRAAIWARVPPDKD